MAKPLVKIPKSARTSLTALTADPGRPSQLYSSVTPSEFVEGSLDSWPVVRYVCNPAFELSFVSRNVSELIGLDGQELIGSRAIWSKMILPEDLDRVFHKLRELERAGTIAFTHRITDRHGLPIWVSHSARRTVCLGVECIYGCLMPMRTQERAALLEPTTISRFIHKMGNHFQLMNLIVNSLRKSITASHEVEALEDSVEKVVELMRAFSEYSQNPTWMSTIELTEIIEAAAITRSSLSVEKRIDLKRNIESTLRDLTMKGDPYLLELAIGEVIQNALEATDEGGEVVLNARAECFDGKPRAVKLTVRDSGHGIEPNDLDRVTAPFFSAKSGHDGLGLSMAARFVELHGGILRVVSYLHEGTEVQIIFPVTDGRDNSCR